MSSSTKHSSLPPCWPTLPTGTDSTQTSCRMSRQATKSSSWVSSTREVGRDAQAWKGVLGNHVVGNCNDNGRLLLLFCAEQELTITNTIFQQKSSHTTTWMYPRSKHWYLIDYVLVKQRDMKDVFHTIVMPSAYHLSCKVNFCIKFKQKTT